MIDSEEALIAKQRCQKWCMNSGATKSCTGDRSLFDTIDETYRSELGTAATPTPIEGKGTVLATVGDGKVRLGNVLYIPALTGNLLSTHELHSRGIGNTHLAGEGYKFIRQGEVVAEGETVGRTSNLEWVKNENALFTGEGTKFDQYDQKARSLRDKSQEMWHRRFGHPGSERFRMLANMIGLDLSGHADPCETCIQAKQVKRQNHQPQARVNKPLKRVHMDVWGPYRQGFRDVKYYLSLVDDYSRFSWVFPITERNLEVIETILDKWMTWVERFQTVQSGYNEKVLVIRTDNAKEFTALEAWSSRHGIEIEFTEPYTPAQNGVAERLNRLLLEIARSLLFDAEIPGRYWEWAVDAANYIRNRSIEVTGTKDITRFELWTGERPRLEHMRRWGCKVLYHERHGDKLASRALAGTFVGYTKSNSQYYVMTVDGRLWKVTNPVFLENKNGHLSTSGSETLDEDILSDVATSENVNNHNHDTMNEIMRDEEERGAEFEMGTRSGFPERTTQPEERIVPEKEKKEDSGGELVQRKSQRLIEKENRKKEAEEGKREVVQKERDRAIEEENKKVEEERNREIDEKQRNIAIEENKRRVAEEKERESYQQRNHKEIEEEARKKAEEDEQNQESEPGKKK